MILFRQKYPRWWFDWNLQLLRFSDSGRRLPGADGRSLPVDRRAAGGAPRLPLPGRAQRTQPLAAARQVAPGDPPLHRPGSSSTSPRSSSSSLAWFAILFTGRFPRGMFDFLVGVGPLAPTASSATRSCSSPTATRRSASPRKTSRANDLGTADEDQRASFPGRLATGWAVGCRRAGRWRGGERVLRAAPARGQFVRSPAGARQGRCSCSTPAWASSH